MTMYSGPRELARSLRALIRSKRLPCPRLSTIEALFQVIYFASLRTEELQPIRCHIIFLDPERPDPKPPPRIRLHRWKVTSFTARMDFTDTNLAKLARATDIRCSSLAVHCDRNGKLFIWGLVDHDNQNAFFTYDSDSGPGMPGLFQASIEGVGRISCYIGYEKAGELHHGQLAGQSHDIFLRGPIRRKLGQAIESYMDEVQKSVPFDSLSRRNWDRIVSGYWIATLCRLVLRIRSLRKGGTVIITDRPYTRGLNVKFAVSYTRLRDALQRNSILKLKKRQLLESSRFSMDRSQTPPKPVVSASHYFDERRTVNEYTDSVRELDNALWFVALLSRIDGVLLLRRDLSVFGFGAEITTRSNPSAVGIASSSKPLSGSVRTVDVSQFGTRHRSVFRYCNADPTSVGVVFSQDGDVRFVTRQQAQVVMWDNVRLRLDDYITLPQEMPKGSPNQAMEPTVATVKNRRRRLV